MSLSLDSPATPDRTLTALGLTLFYATLISLTDNLLRFVALGSSLWQFHLLRSAMVLALVIAALPFLKSRFRPRHPWAVLARSLIQAAAIMIYFGVLAFLPVAVAAAGLFTAPIFVLLIERFAYRRPLTWVKVMAVIMGFTGAILMLGNVAGALPGIMILVPILSGALYGLSNVATRDWCPGESAVTLTFGFFAALGFYGLLGLIVIAHLAPTAPLGSAGFILRGWVPPSLTILFWILVQAAGALLAVTAMIRAYQLAPVARVAVFEYLTLPASAFWGFILWQQVLGWMAVLGMGLIALAGIMISWAKA